MKAEFNRKMDDQKQLVENLEKALKKSKSDYSNTLGSLEALSFEIHQVKYNDVFFLTFLT